MKNTVPLLSVFLLLLVLPVGPAAAQTADQLFDDTRLHDLQITINSKDWQKLQDHFGENTFYPVDITSDGIRVRNAGMRSRGLGSRNPIKPGFKIEFDKYCTGQTFFGLKTLVLDNNVQDPSMLRERLVSLIFKRMGQPAPREVSVRLFLNGDYMGVYTLIEEVDDLFARRTFGEDGGELFEYKYFFAYYGTDLGSLEAYVPLFEPRTHHQDPISTLYGPVRELFRTASEATPDTFRDSVGQYLDLSAFATHLAIETFSAENDAILGYAGMNNFYLYRSVATRRYRFILWDRDQGLFQTDLPLLRGVEENTLARGTLAQPDLRDLFFNTLLDAAASIVEPDENGVRWLDREVERLYQQIRDAAVVDPKKFLADSRNTNEEFEAQVEFLRGFAAARAAYVVSEVTRLRGQAP